MGSTAEADKILSQALAMASENELNLYAYQLMNKGRSG